MIRPEESLEIKGKDYKLKELDREVKVLGLIGILNHELILLVSRSEDGS